MQVSIGGYKHANITKVFQVAWILCDDMGVGKTLQTLAK
jgi:hypothetical protein